MSEEVCWILYSESLIMLMFWHLSVNVMWLHQSVIARPEFAENDIYICTDSMYKLHVDREEELI